MIEKPPLREQRVKEISQSLTEAQRKFMEATGKQSRKSKWLEVLAKHKGIVFDENTPFDEIEEAIDDWVLEDILDGGLGNRPFKCECGKTLRYQYIVHHHGRNKTYKLGKECFGNYTGLPPEVIKDIKEGFYHIDLERDEILLQFEAGTYYDIAYYMYLEIPELMLQQVALGLPLTGKQLSKLHKLHEEAQEAKRAEEARNKFLEEEKRLAEIEKNLTQEQLDFIKTNYDPEEKRELLNKIDLQTGLKYSVAALEDIGVSKIIIRHTELGLPLLNSQEKSVELWQSIKLRQERDKQRPNQYNYHNSSGEKFTDRDAMVELYNQYIKCKESKALSFFTWCQKALMECKKDFERFGQQGYLWAEEAGRLEKRLNDISQTLRV